MFFEMPGQLHVMTLTKAAHISFLSTSVTPYFPSLPFDNPYPTHTHKHNTHVVPARVNITQWAVGKQIKQQSGTLYSVMKYLMNG